MPTLSDKDTGQVIGQISETDLEFLADQLEEESSEDTDYYIDEPTIDMLEDEGGSPTLISLLRNAVAARGEGLDIAWTKD